MSFWMVDMHESLNNQRDVHIGMKLIIKGDNYDFSSPKGQVINKSSLIFISN